MEYYLTIMAKNHLCRNKRICRNVNGCTVKHELGVNYRNCIRIAKDLRMVLTAGPRSEARAKADRQWRRQRAQKAQHSRTHLLGGEYYPEIAGRMVPLQNF